MSIPVEAFQLKPLGECEPGELVRVGGEWCLIIQFDEEERGYVALTGERRGQPTVSKGGQRPALVIQEGFHWRSCIESADVVQQVRDAPLGSLVISGSDWAIWVGQPNDWAPFGVTLFGSGDIVVDESKMARAVSWSAELYEDEPYRHLGTLFKVGDSR